jgi:hypothetical protein
VPGASRALPRAERGAAGRWRGSVEPLITGDSYHGNGWWCVGQTTQPSVGSVAAFDALFKGRNGHERPYQEEVDRWSAVRERIAPGQRVTGYFAARDYSYRLRVLRGVQLRRVRSGDPELLGTVTDVLIGDLFTDRVDKVWGPIESLRPPGKAPIPAWDAGLAAGLAPEKSNALVLPAGLRP